jgi:hypothetical protein
MKYSDVYMTRQWIISLTKISNKELDDYIRTFNLNETEEGLPIFALLNSIHLKSKAPATIQPDELKDEIIMKKINQQKLLAAYIANQSRLNLFVPKAIAELRMTKTLTAVSGLIRTAIITMSPNLLNISDTRLIQEIITNAWNEAVDTLYEASDQISWEDEGDAALMERKLYKMAGSDPLLCEVVDQAYDKHDEY